MTKGAPRFHACTIGLLVAFAACCRLPEAGQPADARRSRATIERLEKWLSTEPADRPPLEKQVFARVALTRPDAAKAHELLLNDRVESIREKRRAEWTDKVVRVGEYEMKFDYRSFGEKPEDGWDLYISLHGGGNTRPAVNDSAWRRHIRLYEPQQGIYLTPRAPTDTWDMWHQAHVDALFDRIIEGAIVHMGVNPNRVYLMGYSAGGDGVYQVAPRMADRWAAAAMMAGHPNDASPLGLRNIGFTLHMGALDGAYNRNQVAAEWKEKLEALRAQAPDGYVHEVQIHEGLGHGMRGKDAVALDWMAQFTRTPLPSKIVWKQDDVTHSRFYWLAVPEDSEKPGAEVVAQCDGQKIAISRASDVNALTIRLNDRMLDLDKPVLVEWNGTRLFEGFAVRSVSTMSRTLKETIDPELAFVAEITVELK